MRHHQQSGNVLFMILIAIALIGALTAAVTTSNRPEGSNIDAETLVLRAAQVQRYAGELERAVRFVLQQGYSESDIRFAHPDANSEYGDLAGDSDKRDQVFHRDGGGANYRSPPDGVNDGSAWEFYGGTHVPGMGRSDRAELVAVLPHVTADFCAKINELNDQTGTMQDTGTSTASGSDPGDCVNVGALGRFDDSRQFCSTINSMNDASARFVEDSNTSAPRPGPPGCVICSADTNSANTTTDEYHFYHVLLTR